MCCSRSFVKIYIVKNVKIVIHSFRLMVWYEHTNIIRTNGVASYVHFNNQCVVSDTRGKTYSKFEELIQSNCQKVYIYIFEIMFDFVKCSLYFF